MQRQKEQSLVGRLQAALPALMGMCLVGAMLIHVLLTVRVGFMSDDYALMHSAQHGLRFWHLHASPPLEFLWRLTAQGLISAYAWHGAILGIHMINVALLYMLARRWCSLDVPRALLVATFYMLSPAGIEALAWTCAAGYVVTMTWILATLLCFLSWRKNARLTWLKAIVLSLMQLGAFLMWEWAVLLLPVLWVFSFIGEHRGWTLLVPVCICWAAAVALRSISDHGVFWQQNDLAKAGQFFFGSPLLGLFPNLNKEAYFSFYMLGLFILLATLLAWAAWRQRLILILLVCFFGAVLPWVKGGNPSSRYFYLAMPFLYLAIVLALTQMKYKSVSWAAAVILLSTQFWMTYERAQLWVEADHAAHALMEQTEALLSASNMANSLVIVNVPEAYGPPQMPMRPQLWYCGFKEYLSVKGWNVAFAKTDDSSFVWSKSSGRLPRHTVAAMYPGVVLYEVVYRPKEFALIPFIGGN